MTDASTKPICRVGKIKRRGKTTPRSVEGEHTRTSNPKNADPKRRADNRWILRPEGGLASAIDAVMRRHAIDPSTLRKDATIANDIVLSASPEWFRPENPEARGTYDKRRVERFQKQAEDLLRETYGDKLVSVVLHLDEATPHIQAVVVPVMPADPEKTGKAWRLSGKDMFDPAALQALQQAWEDRLEPLGVGKRTKGSKARHTTLREYYSAIEATRSEAVDTTPSDPPIRGRLQSDEAYQAELKAWKKAEKARLKPLKAQAAMGRLYDAERRSAAQLRGEVTLRDERISEAYTMLDEATEAVRLGKAEIDRLRKAPINEVALALGYVGKIGPRENAIDLVMRVGRLDYQKATQWLAERLGASVAATAVREAALPALEAAEGRRTVMTAAEAVKVKAITAQLKALAAPHYRITLMRQVDGKKVGKNLGKAADGGPERFWTAAEVVAKIPELTVANAMDRNILITPIDSATRHVLIDDVKPEGLEELRKRGYAPALVLETSPNNHQVVVKVGSDLPKDAANQWFRDINVELGDDEITGLVHPMRLAGFQNRKDKHREADEGQRPFVRVLEAVNRFCGHAAQTIRQYALNGLEARNGVSAERGPALGKRQ